MQAQAHMPRPTRLERERGVRRHGTDLGEQAKVFGLVLVICQERGEKVGELVLCVLNVDIRSPDNSPADWADITRQASICGGRSVEFIASGWSKVYFTVTIVSQSTARTGWCVDTAPRERERERERGGNKRVGGVKS